MEVEQSLIIEALNELAEHMGHSNFNPLSISLVCINANITEEQKSKIYSAFNRIMIEHEDEMTFNMFKKAVNDIVPHTSTYSDITIMAIIKAFARNVITDLLPFAENLEVNFDSCTIEE